MKRFTLLLLLLLLALALALGACSQGTDSVTDYYGNPWPSDCPASIVSDPGLLSLIDVQRRHVAGTLGTTAKGLGGRFVVTLDPSLSGWMLDDVKRHEFAHVKRWIETGNPDWHARMIPNSLPAARCADAFHC